MSPPAATRPGSTLRSGPERGGGGVRGRYVGGRPWAGAAAAVGAEAGWAGAASTLPGAPTVAAVAGQKTVTGSALPAIAAAPALGDGPELVTVGVREAEQRPLLRSLFRWGPRRCLWWQSGPSPLPSAVVSGLYPGNFWPRDLGAMMVWGIFCSLFPEWRPLPGPWVRLQPGSLHFVFPKCLRRLLSLPSPPPPAQYLDLA